MLGSVSPQAHPKSSDKVETAMRIAENSSVPPIVSSGTPDLHVTAAANMNDVSLWSRGAVGSPSFEAIFVFTLIRHDLLDSHLASIDHPTRHVFVILNYASETIKSNMLTVLDTYKNCSHTSKLLKQRRCRNPNIKKLHVISSPHNIGFAGNCNMGFKAMLEFDISYALFSGDDTRFLPEKIRAAKSIIEGFPNVCMFHFEAYSSFGITRSGVRRIGPFDENFWPAYAEDCDYWFRAILVGCSMFYRGGYSPEMRSSHSRQNAFVEHGDINDPNLISSVTYKSDPNLGRLVEGTLHPTRGRFAYLSRKWGVNTCVYYHEFINKWRDKDEIIAAPNVSELLAHEAKPVYYPYDDPSNFGDVRRWLRGDWKKPGAISSRAVNCLQAPADLVWQEADYLKLDSIAL